MDNATELSPRDRADQPPPSGAPERPSTAKPAARPARRWTSRLAAVVIVAALAAVIAYALWHETAAPRTGGRFRNANDGPVPVRAVAACIPGMVVDSLDAAGDATGRMEVGIGPIKASFSGTGHVERFVGEFRQRVTGTGGDRKSGSRASGEVDYRLTTTAMPSGEEATRVDVVLAYALTGPLAQFGRSSLVRDLAELEAA